MEQNTTVNYGLDLAKEKADQSAEDWVFGSSSPTCLTAGMISTERPKYLPAGEIQKGKEDTMDCASRAPVNILETKFNYLFLTDRISPENKQWLIDNGYFSDYGITFSDAFVAINSGTTRNGNSLKAPCDAIYNFGMVPKDRLPLLKTMTWDEYHDPARVTPELKALGLEFKKRFTINYERVLEKDFAWLLTEDLLDVGGYAWPRPKNGIYPRSENQPNHAFIVVHEPLYVIFDNYLDSVDGDYIKRLASDYDLMDYGYRVIITSEQVIKDDENVEDEPVTTPVVPLWKWILDFIKQLFNKKTV